MTASTLQRILDHRLPVASALGVAGLVILFTLGLRSPSGFYVALVLCLIASLCALPQSRAITRQPVFWIVLLLFVTVFLRGWFDLATAAARGFEPDPEGIWHHARYTPLAGLICGLWLAAWWHLRYVFLVCIGIAACIFVFNQWSYLTRMLPGGEQSRLGSYPEGGLVTATTFFLAAGAAVAAFTGRMSRVRWRNWAIGAVTALITAFLLVILVFTLARAAWLAFAFTCLIVPLATLAYALYRGTPRQRRIALITAAGCGLTLTFVVAASWDILAQRIARDSEMIMLALSGEITRENLPGGSFGLRYRMLRQGLIDAGNQPWIGVGPASVRDMTHELWGKPAVGSGNYHNTWLNLSVAMGLPWAVLWVAVHIWAIGRAVHQLIVVHGDRIFAYSLASAALTHFGILTFQTRIWSVEGSALYIILITLVFGVLLYNPIRNTRLARQTSAEGAAPSSLAGGAHSG